MYIVTNLKAVNMKSKIVLIGGFGFIGYNLLNYLSSCNRFDIYVIDYKNRSDICFPCNFFMLDICDYEALLIKLVSVSPDYIIHLAARTDLEGKTLEDYNANILGVENLMKVANQLPNLKKILITSSMLVCHTGYYPKNQFDYSPSTLYGESKVRTEQIVWENKPHCDWALLRPTSIWGPYFGVPYRNFFDMIMHHRYFHVGNKGCTKTYGYVGNAIYQIEQILYADTRDDNNKVFYIGDYAPTNIEEWGNEIAEQLGTRIIKMPYFLIKLAAFLGDALKVVGVNFPMTSFRLKNMTTDNIIDLSNTKMIAPNLPYTRKEGVRATLKWMMQA